MPSFGQRLDISGDRYIIGDVGYLNEDEGVLIRGYQGNVLATFYFAAAKVYMIVYGVEGYDVKGLLNFAKIELEEAKINPNRVVLLEGGIREDITTELFIVSKGALPPAPAPALNPAIVK